MLVPGLVIPASLMQLQLVNVRDQRRMARLVTANIPIDSGRKPSQLAFFCSRMAGAEINLLYYFMNDSSAAEDGKKKKNGRLIAFKNDVFT